MTRRGILGLAGAAVVVVSALAYGGLALNRGAARQASDRPVAIAKRGEFVVVIRCRGDVKASRSVPIYAPIVPNLTIAWMAPEGEEVREGSPLIRFDSSSAEQQLVQREAALKQAQGTLDQAIVQAKVTVEQDRGDTEDARLNVETARLKMLDNEFVGRIQAEQAKVDVGIAEQRLRMQEANVALHAAADRSKIASLTRQRDQARGEVELTRARLAQMELRAPLTGFLVVAMNNSQGPLSGTPFKIGDNVFSGMSLAEMPDMTSLIMDAQIEEIDRGRIAAGAEVRVRIDALPELLLNATITSISPLAEVGSEWPPVRSFRAYASLQKADPRIRPGMNGSLDVIVQKMPDAISIPSKAVFTRDGKPIVYVANGSGYAAVPIQILARNPEEVAVSGISQGAVVSLTDLARDHDTE